MGYGRLVGDSFGAGLRGYNASIPNPWQAMLMGAMQYLPAAIHEMRQMKLDRENKSLRERDQARSDEYLAIAKANAEEAKKNGILSDQRNAIKDYMAQTYVDDPTLGGLTNGMAPGMQGPPAPNMQPTVKHALPWSQIAGMYGLDPSTQEPDTSGMLEQYQRKTAADMYTRDFSREKWEATVANKEQELSMRNQMLDMRAQALALTAAKNQPGLFHGPPGKATIEQVAGVMFPGFAEASQRVKDLDAYDKQWTAKYTKWSQAGNKGVMPGSTEHTRRMQERQTISTQVKEWETDAKQAAYQSWATGTPLSMIQPLAQQQAQQGQGQQDITSGPHKVTETQVGNTKTTKVTPVDEQGPTKKREVWGLGKDGLPTFTTVNG